MIMISVVMPVYNPNIEYLRESVESILNQTFRNFEFIIIDDGSTNNCVQYLNRLHDNRIRIIKNPTNLGISKSLNIGIKAANGKYIARMDCDDISLPTRFEIQYRYMEAHPDIILCGTSTERFGKVNKVCKVRMSDMGYYRAQLLFSNPGPTHPTAFFNRDMLQQNGILYNESLIYAQDYDMWTNVSRFGNVVVLDDVLLRYRIHSEQVSQIHREQQINCIRTIHKRLLTELLGFVMDTEVEMHTAHSSLYYYPNAVMTPAVNDWYRRIIKANKAKHIYDQKHIERRIEVIKKRLLQNTCSGKTTTFKKIYLYARYYPVLRAAIRNLKKKLLYPPY